MKIVAAMSGHQIISRKEWLKALITLLAQENDLTRQPDARRRAKLCLNGLNCQSPHSGLPFIV